MWMWPAPSTTSQCAQIQYRSTEEAFGDQAGQQVWQVGHKLSRLPGKYDVDQVLELCLEQGNLDVIWKRAIWGEALKHEVTRSYGRF